MASGPADNDTLGGSRYPSNVLQSVYKQAYQRRDCPPYEKTLGVVVASSGGGDIGRGTDAAAFVGATSYKLHFMPPPPPPGTSSSSSTPTAPSPSNFMGDGAPHSVLDERTTYKVRFWNNSKEFPRMFARIQSSPTLTLGNNFNDSSSSSSFCSDTTHRFHFRPLPMCRRLGLGAHSSSRVNVAKGAALDNKTTYDQNFKKWTMVDPHSVSVVRNVDDNNSCDSKFIGETQYKNDFKAHEQVPKVPSHCATSVFQLQTRPSTRQ